MNPAGRARIYAGGPTGGPHLKSRGVALGKRHPFLHVARANRVARRGWRDCRERLSEAGMVDLLGMFRRRPAKRSGPGFARSRVDITALGDNIGEMLTSPVRDAPPIARDAPPPRPEPPRAERPKAEKPARTPRPKANGGGAQAPRLLQRPGFLAVHSVEKSFGSRQVVRGRQHLCAPWRGGGTPGPERRRQDHGVLHDHRPDQGRSRRHRTRRPRRHQAADVSARQARHRVSAAGSVDLPRPHRGTEYPRRARGGGTLAEEARGPNSIRCSRNSTSRACARRRRLRCRAASGGA